MQIETAIPNRAFIIRNVFSEQECQEIIEKTEQKGYGSLKDNYDESYRNNSRLTMEHNDLLLSLWNRITNLIPLKTIDEKGLKWQLYGLNPLFRFCKYQKDQYFKKHLDGSFQSQYNIRSCLTCNIYLNSNFTGGYTNFYDENNALIYQLKPETGLVLLFIHDTFHEGATIESGLKYLMRTDVMYKRQPYPNEKKEELSKQAFDLQKQAFNFEIDGRKEEAYELFNKASSFEHQISQLK
jgi:hypothetical protein